MGLAHCTGFEVRDKKLAGMEMKRIGKTFLCLAALLLALLGASASADATITFSPENPKMGEYVDVVVQPDRAGAQGVLYTLKADSETVYEAKEKELTEHYTASFRPRKEGTYTLTATLVYGKKDTESVSVTIPVSGIAPAQEAPDVVYSQKDGWWHDKIYSKKHRRSLEKAGCAIFSLSHALQRMGRTGEDICPDKLAEKYTGMYIEGRGTDNEGLLVRAGSEYGFQTYPDLIETEHGIATSLKRGDMLSFSVALGHIAMADGISEDGTKVHVIDSAPGATYERKDRFKTKGHIYFQQADGSFVEAKEPEDLPGMRWFFETGEYGGMAYWMDITYCASRGMRMMIATPWLQAQADGELVPAGLEYAGALVSRVTLKGEEVRVPTSTLTWTTPGADGPRIALITNKKGTYLMDGNKKPLRRYSKKQNVGTMMMALGVEDDLCYVFWKDTFGYVSLKDVELLPAQEGGFSTGIVSMNGKTAGTAKVIARNSPLAKGAKVTEWTIGTPVAVVETGKDFTLVEGKGRRGWILNKYLTPDQSE